MLLLIQQYVSKIKPVTIDGTLYALIALFGCLEISFASDEAKELISKALLFWIKTIIAASAAVVGSLKMFRSTTYSKHLESKKDEKTISSSKLVDTDNSGIKTEQIKTVENI